MSRLICLLLNANVNSWITTCSGHTVPRDVEMIRGEALRDALVPDYQILGESGQCDGSRVLSLGPFVWVADVPICIAYGSWF